MRGNFVIYRLTDSSIVGYYRVDKNSALLYPINPLIEGRIDLPVGHSSFYEQHKWRVSGLTLVQKDEVTITADKAQIVADAVDEATLTFSGLSADTKVGVNGDLITIPVMSPALVITSDVPEQFIIVVHDPLYWSLPFGVVAK